MHMGRSRAVQCPPTNEVCERRQSSNPENHSDSNASLGTTGQAGIRRRCAGRSRSRRLSGRRQGRRARRRWRRRAPTEGPEIASFWWYDTCQAVPVGNDLEAALDARGLNRALVLNKRGRCRGRVSRAAVGAPGTDERCVPDECVALHREVPG